MSQQDLVVQLGLALLVVQVAQKGLYQVDQLVQDFLLDQEAQQDQVYQDFLDCQKHQVDQ